MERYGSARSSGGPRILASGLRRRANTVNRIKRGEQRIRNLSVSLLGGIQPERLKELHGLTSDGLLQRFLPSCSESQRFQSTSRLTRPPIDTWHLTMALLGARPATIIMTNDAYSAATEARRKLHDIEQVGGGLAQGFQAFVGKLPGVLGSLALILHVIEGPHHGNTLPVEAKTVASAARLVEDFILPHAFEFYRTAESVTEGDRLQKLASYILTCRQETHRRVRSHDERRGVPRAHLVGRKPKGVAAGGGWVAHGNRRRTRLAIVGCQSRRV